MANSQFLVFTDLDGTYLDHENYSFAPSAVAANALFDMGHIVIPNTSKTIAELEYFRQQQGWDTPFIAENGAAVLIPKSSLTQQPKGTIERGGYWLKQFSNNRNHWIDLIARFGSRFTPHFTGFSVMTNEYLQALTGLTYQEASRASLREFGEPIYWHGDKRELDKFADVLRAQGAEVLHGGRFIHVSGKCDKGQALKWLTNVYREQNPQNTYKTIALGDSGNDIAMLEAANVSVLIKSPSHSFPEIKKNNEVYFSTLTGPFGWAETIHQLILDRPIGGPING